MRKGERVREVGRAMPHQKLQYIAGGRGARRGRERDRGVGGECCILLGGGSDGLSTQRFWPKQRRHQ